MNLLVEELALRCKEYKLQVDGARVDFDYKKFAELIVTECMNAVCDPNITYLESMTESSAMYTARERIRKHFRS